MLANKYIWGKWQVIEGIHNKKTETVNWKAKQSHFLAPHLIISL